MSFDECVQRIQEAFQQLGGPAVYAAAVLDGASVDRPGGPLPLAEVFPDEQALGTAVHDKQLDAVAVALRGVAALDGERLEGVCAALVGMAEEDGQRTGELTAAAMFALAHGTGAQALEILAGGMRPGSAVPLEAVARSVHPGMGPRLLALLEATGTLAAGPVRRPSVVEWRSLSDEERARLRPEDDPPPSEAHETTVRLLHVLGRRAEAGAVEPLLAMLRGHPHDGLRLAAAEALARFTDERAVAGLDACIVDADWDIAQVAVGAAVRRDVAGAWSRFLPDVERILGGGLSQPHEWVLSALFAVLAEQPPPGSVDVLEAEPRFVDLAAQLRRHPTLGDAARLVLERVPRGRLEPVLDRFPRPSSPSSPGVLPSRRDFLSRYTAGEHGVWEELKSAAAAIALHPDLRAEAEAVARSLMTRVQGNVEAVRSTLAAAGAPVGLAGTPCEPAAYARLVSQVGPLPLALEQLWRVVGSVQLLRPLTAEEGPRAPCALEADGIALVALDPLELDGADAAAEAIEDYEARLATSHAEVVGPLVLPLAPDSLHKQDLSGGPPYSIELPPRTVMDEIDPPFLHEAHHTTLVGYLRLAFSYGGFPMLAVAQLPEEKIAPHRRIAFKGVKGSWATAAEKLRQALLHGVVPF